jgi:hypothetical protein
VSDATQARNTPSSSWTAHSGLFLGTLAVVPLVAAVRSAQEAAGHILSLLERRPAIDAEAPGGRDVKDVQGTLELRHVSFAYPARPHMPVCQVREHVGGSGLHRDRGPARGASAVVGAVVPSRRTWDPHRPWYSMVSLRGGTYGED